jgi:hypothetical protein
MLERALHLVVAAALVQGLGCGGSSATSCEQESNGGLSLAQCTCAAMTASAPMGSKVILVASIKSDQLDPKYDVGLPAGTPVCFVAVAGEFTVPGPPGPSAADASAVTDKYAFSIYTESPWVLTESGLTPTQPTPASE